MRPVIVGVPPKAVTDLRNLTSPKRLEWTDNSTNEINFIVESSSTTTGPWTTVSVVASTTGRQRALSTDILGTGAISGQAKYYRVIVNNVVGDTTCSPPLQSVSHKLVKFSAVEHSPNLIEHAVIREE